MSTRRQGRIEIRLEAETTDGSVSFNAFMRFSPSELKIIGPVQIPREEENAPYGQGAMGDFRLPTANAGRRSARTPSTSGIDDISSNSLREDRNVGAVDSYRPAPRDRDSARREGDSYRPDRDGPLRKLDGRRGEREPLASRSAATSSDKQNGSNTRRDGRADDAGWRSATAKSSGRSDSRRDADGGRPTLSERASSTRDKAPAWMEDDDSPSAQAQDSSITSSSWTGQSALSKAADSARSAESQSDAKADAPVEKRMHHIDELQAWKAEMKEMDRKRREAEMGISSKPEPAESTNTLSYMSSASHSHEEPPKQAVAAPSSGM